MSEIEITYDTVSWRIGDHSLLKRIDIDFSFCGYPTRHNSRDLGSDYGSKRAKELAIRPLLDGNQHIDFSRGSETGFAHQSK